MKTVDVNILIYAFIPDLEHSKLCSEIMRKLVTGDSPFAASELVLAAFLRIVTNPKAFKPPAPLPTALSFARRIMEAPGCISIQPGERHWSLFVEMCEEISAKGNDISDAYYAALAVESGLDWLSTDQGFARFKELRWINVLDPKFKP